MMKRAQSMGINLVIIAAIALLVLVIIALIVSNGGKNLNEGTKSCVAQGGRCYTPGTAPVDALPLPGASGCSQNLGESCYKYVFD